nr:DUF362 domain-containing protein [Methanohalophilus levihalophilus]
MDNRVVIASCPDYSAAKGAVREAVAELGGMKRFVNSGDRVLIKPNLLAAHVPEDAVTTHPEVVAAVCDLVIEAGGIPMVGDCAGITHPGATAKAFEVSGIGESTLNTGGDVVNFQQNGFRKVEVPGAKHFPELYISKDVLDADVVINLPKLKTHELTLMTGAVKNMFGTVPLKIRKESHLLADPDVFSEAVLEIFSAATPQLSIMDAVLCMEGHGPSRGSPVHVGAIIASANSFALDIVAAQVMGFDKMDIPTNRVAARKGLDTDLEITGIPIEDVTVSFKRPPRGVLRLLPPWITSIVGRAYKVNPEINTFRCQLCGACVSNCPADAIKKEGSSLKIDDKQCILCYCCRELCPYEAVDIKKSLLAKILSRD